MDKIKPTLHTTALTTHAWQLLVPGWLAWAMGPSNAYLENKRLMFAAFSVRHNMRKVYKYHLLLPTMPSLACR